MIRFFSFILVLIILPNTLVAQDSLSVKLKVFVEGKIPDFDFLRNDISFVDFVNDPYVSDVHIIVTRKSTGSGGNHYYISFNPVTIETDDLNIDCITSFEDTQDDVRSKFAECIKSGLLIFANQKQLYYQVKVVDNRSEENGQTPNSHTIDPWNHWVFNIGLQGGFEAEEQKQEYDYETKLKIDRVTEKLRIRNEYSFSREETFISKYEGSTKRVIHAFNQEQKLASRIAYSLSSHWSLGLFLQGNQTSYRNIRFNANTTSALEYNFYPWKEVNRRLFTIGYYVGPSYYDYYEPTLFNKEAELLWGQSLKIELERVEKWGEIDVWLEAAHYFHDIKYHSLEIGTELSIRIAKGLFLGFGFQAEKINNQLYLPASELSDEDLLLDVRKLPTSFELEGGIGISYRFGSIYNNVVNLRL